MLMRLTQRLALLPLALQTIVVLVAAQSTTRSATTASISSDSESEATATPTVSDASSTTPTRTSTKTGPATHTIKVGPKVDPHQYVPPSVKADVGDVILFEFYPRNHSVVQADYLAPCVPGTGDIFYSGVFNDFEEEDGALVGNVSITCGCI